MSDTPTMNSKAALKLISEIEARTEKLKAMFEPVPANAGAGKSDSEKTGPVRKTRTKKTSSADEAPKTAPRISRIAGKDAEALYTGFDKDDKKGRTAHREAFNKYVESLSNDVFMAKDSQRALIDEFNKTVAVTAAEPVTDGHESAASEAE